MRCFFCTKNVLPGEAVKSVEYLGSYVNAHELCAANMLAEKTTPLVRSTTTTIKENIMADNTTPTTPQDTATSEQSEVQTQNRLQSFVNTHPRAAKLVAVTGAIGTAAGAVLFAKTLQSNKSHLDAAGNHVQGAVSELSAAVVPQDPAV